MSDRAKLSETQLHVMRHAVGIGQGTPFFRNRFVTGPGSSDWKTLLSLEEAGLMARVKQRIPFLEESDVVFYVTDKGKDLLVDGDERSSGASSVNRTSHTVEGKTR